MIFAIVSNFFFLLLCSLMLLVIMIQQTRGEIGFGAAPSKGTQLVFGGSGGQEFFEKVTWALGVLFFVSCLSMAYFQSKEQSRSILESYQQVVIGKASK